MVYDAIRELQKQMSLISQSATAYDKMLADITKSTSTIASLQGALTKQFELDHGILDAMSTLLSKDRQIFSVTSNFQDLSRVNATLTSLASAANLTDSISKIFADHSAMRSSIAAIVSESSATKLLSSLDTTRLLHTSLSSQLRLLRLEEVSFGSQIDASILLANDLNSNFGKLTSSYRDLVERIPSIPENHVPFVAKYSPIEYSLELDVLEQISVEDPEEGEQSYELPSVDDELAEFDDKLLILIRGARQSLSSENADRARHVTTSVRELFTHILHGLAPDDKIREWTKDREHYHNNRPTRRARLLYICRNFSCDPLNKFVEDDVQAALTLVDSLNAGTHVIQSKLTKRQLEAIVYRMESLASFLLRVSKSV